MPNFLAKIRQKSGNNEKMETYFIVQCVKKVSLRKKVGRGAKKKGIKLAWHYIFYYLCKEEISKNYTYYIITL